MKNKYRSIKSIGIDLTVSLNILFITVVGAVIVIFAVAVIDSIANIAGAIVFYQFG